MHTSIDLFFHFLTRSAQLPEELRQRHRHWLIRQQSFDGGFVGRSRNSNLYYTGFGARLCAILLPEMRDPWLLMQQYLVSQLQAINTIVDLASATAVYVLLRLLIEESLSYPLVDPLRQRGEQLLTHLSRPDGGFAKSEQSGAGSTYATFLALNAMNLLEIPFPDAERIVAFVCSRQRHDGGFAEVPYAREAATTPTAAAVSILADVNALDRIDTSKVIEYLHGMQRPDGGFAAGPFAPVSDLLSTCAALSALWILNNSNVSRLDMPRIEAFVLGLENSEGGFKGCILDDQPDVEYTFYGLATLALLRP